jgi:hypothetical protein
MSARAHTATRAVWLLKSLLLTHVGHIVRSSRVAARLIEVAGKHPRGCAGMIGFDSARHGRAFRFAKTDKSGITGWGYEQST